jgi:molybdate transport system permease protein
VKGRSQPLLALPAAVLVALLVLPVGALLVRASTSGALSDAITSRVVFDALGLSLGTSAASLLLTVLLGTPLALLLARGGGRLHGVLSALVELPIVLPPSVAGLALLLLLGTRGPLGAPLDALGIALPFTTAAVVLAQTFVSAPFYVSAARAGFAGVDRDLQDAARVDGAGEWRVLRDVTAPLAAGALAGGMVMAWARALGEFGATILFAGNLPRVTQTLPLVVYEELQGGVDASVAAASVLVVAALGVLVAVRLLGRQPSELRGLAGRLPGQPSR